MEEVQPTVLCSRLVPEKRALSFATQGKLHCHFWNGAVKSTRTPDGAIATPPSEPASLPILTPSGLSRAQSLQATQAIGIPATPSFSGSQGGVVLDRALSMHGGQKWWAAFVGRVKVQELLTRQRRSGTVKAVVDPSLYALHGVVRARPSRNTFLRACLQADSLAGLVAHPPSEPAPKLSDSVSAASELTAHISGHRLTSRLSANELVLSAPASYLRAPLTATVDLEPLPQRQSPLVYRVGLHQTVMRLEQDQRKQRRQQQQQQHAAATANGAGSDAEGGQQAEGGGARGGAASSSGRDMLQDWWSTCIVGTAVQGAVAVHGAKVLWRSRRSDGGGRLQPTAAEDYDESPTGGSPTIHHRPAAQQHLVGSFQDTAEGSENGARLITAGDVLAALSDSATSLRGATQQLQDAAGWVASGGLQDALRGRSRSGREAGRQPRSSFLAGPHLQAVGILGAAGRAGFSNTGGLAPPILTPFASGGLSLQLGWFARPLLDFTRLSAQLDLGLPRPTHPPGAPAAAAPSRPPLAPLDARPSATVSVAQQLYGPLRLCADWRLALDSEQPLAPLRAHPREQAGRAAAHLRGLRPSLLDAAYALDVVVPGSKGLARVVAWYAPLRKEGMVELRLL